MSIDQQASIRSAIQEQILNDNVPRQNITDPPIENPMQYIDTPEDQVWKHKQIEAAITTAYQSILLVCPRSAVRKLQESRMWANAAIVFDGRTYQT